MQRGAVLLAVLVTLSVLALGATSAIVAGSTERQRRDETELLFVGEQYRRAIDAYVAGTPAGIRTWPRSVDDLLLDTRSGVPQRHLRKALRDPMGGDMEMLKNGEALVGVRSRSTRKPFKTAGFEVWQKGFASADSYTQWEFRARAGEQMP